MSADDRGDWIPWYVDDSPTWLRLSLAARGAAEGIARKMGPRRGELRLGSLGLEGLADLLRVPWAELEPALAELLAGPHPRFLVSEDQRVLIDPDHASRRLKGSTLRMQRKRARDAAEAACEDDVTDVAGVTERHIPPPNVTRVTPSRLISSDLSDLGSDLSGRSEDPPQVTAREPDRPPPSEPPPAPVLAAEDLPDVPPPWWGAAVATAEQTTGRTCELAAARWLEYRGARERKGWRPSQRDAVGWLAAVLTSDARRAREGPPRRPAAIVQSAEHRAYVLPPEMP